MKTIDDLVREIREHDNIALWEERITYGYTGPYFEQDIITTRLHQVADRIESACRRLEAEKSRIIAELNEVRELNRKCCDENERLKAALQHVLEVELNQVNGHPCTDGDYCTSSEYGVCDHDGNEIDNESIADALSAIGRAQRTYKEGTDK